MGWVPGKLTWSKSLLYHGKSFLVGCFQVLSMVFCGVGVPWILKRCGAIRQETVGHFCTQWIQVWDYERLVFLMKAHAIWFCIVDGRDPRKRLSQPLQSIGRIMYNWQSPSPPLDHHWRPTGQICLDEFISWWLIGDGMDWKICLVYIVLAISAGYCWQFVTSGIITVGHYSPVNLPFCNQSLLAIIV